MPPAHLISRSHQWLGADGYPLHAHGGGVLLARGRFWWVGESEKLRDDTRHHVHCYSSDDLIQWRDEGVALRNQQVRGLNGEEAQDGWVIERPKLLFNRRTGLYVMWFHLEKHDRYTLNAAGVATSDAPCSPYTFRHTLRPGGLRSLDASLFQDEHYAYRVMDVEHKAVVVMRLSADYLNTTGAPVAVPAHAREAPVLFRFRGRYFLATSGITWWNPNPTIVYEAPTLRGPWRSIGSPFNHSGNGGGARWSNAANSYRSQPNFVLVYETAQGDEAAVWMADRWCPSGDVCARPWCECLLGASYLWLPIRWHARQPRRLTVDYVPRWRPAAPRLPAATADIDRESARPERLPPLPPNPPMPPPPPPSPPRFAQCEAWCRKNPEDWAAKCGWDTLACAACLQCSRPSSGGGRGSGNVRTRKKPRQRRAR